MAEEEESTVSAKFLRDIGLTGGKHAKRWRIRLGEELRIGYTNSKQLEKRLSMFGITEKEVEETLNKIKKEGFDE